MTAGLHGGLMVCGTASDSGKSTVVAGLCRLLARRGVKVAPFKAQNMALNSAVTVDGAEIGRAQAAQAHAAGVQPEAAMNPILLKPTGERTSQVVVMGRPWATLDAVSYQKAKPELWHVVTEALEDLRARFDVVICEGAGSPAEINLLDDDIVNLRIARDFAMRSVLVGDIDRGGVFAALYGTVSLLPEDLRRTVGGFVLNKFRGDPAILAPAPERLEQLTGIPTLGVLPWIDAPLLDAEDSLALRSFGARRASGDGADATLARLDVAVIRLPRISNFTDVEPLAMDPGVGVRLVENPGALGRPDLVIVPGSKSTVADLDWMRNSGLAGAIEGLAHDPAGPTILGICGGFQMLGEKIDDPIESPAPQVVEGLGLLAVRTVFGEDKITALRRGRALGEELNGYEIHHGRTGATSPWIDLEGAAGEGVAEGASTADGRVLGTSLHGLFESDGFRRAFLGAVAARSAKKWSAGAFSFAAAREARADVLADALEQHLDIGVLENLIGEAPK